MQARGAPDAAIGNPTHDGLLHGLNPERILVGAEGVGIVRAALERAARYARERIVFRPPPPHRPEPGGPAPPLTES